MAQSSDTFCILPWIHVANRPDGKLVPCCLNAEVLQMPDGKLASLDQHKLADVWQESSLREIRRDFMAGRKRESCSACYQDEMSGQESYRLRANREWTTKLGIEKVRKIKTDAAAGKTSFSPAYMDLRIGSKCNLKCRMCFPINSSSIASEYREISESGQSFPNYFLPTASEQREDWSEAGLFAENLEATLPTLKELYLPGGEPMLSPKISQVLQKIIQSNRASDIDLKFHTNTSLWNEDIISLLPQFRKVRINCSIDGVGATDEYIRYPTKFAVVEKNFDRYLDLSAQHPQIEVYVSCTVSILNIFELSKLVRWFNNKSQRPSGRPINLVFTAVHQPDFLSLKMIPDFLRVAALNEIENCLALLKFSSLRSLWVYDSLRAFKTSLRQTDADQISEENIAHLLSFQRTLDQRRRQSGYELNTHFSALLKNYEQPTKSVQTGSDRALRFSFKALLFTTLWRLWKIQDKLSHLYRNGFN